MQATSLSNDVQKKYIGKHHLRAASSACTRKLKVTKADLSTKVNNKYGADIFFQIFFSKNETAQILRKYVGKRKPWRINSLARNKQHQGMAAKICLKLAEETWGKPNNWMFCKWQILFETADLGVPWGARIVGNLHILYSW